MLENSEINSEKNLPKVWDDAYIANTYIYEECIGGSADTFLVSNKIDKKKYVLKQLKHFDEKIYTVIQTKKIKGIPHLYEIYRTGSDDEKRLVIVEEYINALSLTEYIKENEITEDFLVNLISSVSAILEELQKINPPIIHRDIKPDNILVNDEKEIYLVDFNISRNYTGLKSKDTVIMGTAGFAAPEQFGFGESDIRTDIYGLGATIKYVMDEKMITSEFLNHFAERCMKISPEERFRDTDEINQFISLKDNNEKSSYALPGFRKNNPIHMLAATLFYAIVIYSAVLYKPTKFVSEYHGFETYINKIGFTLALFSAFLFACNYRNCQGKIKWLGRQSGTKRLLGVVFVDIILVLTIAAVVAAVSVIASAF